MNKFSIIQTVKFINELLAGEQFEQLVSLDLGKNFSSEEIHELTLENGKKSHDAAQWRI